VMSREELVEIGAKAGYEFRMRKTGSAPWDERDPDDRRRYREIVHAAIDAIEDVLPVVPSVEPQLPEVVYEIRYEDGDEGLYYPQGWTLDPEVARRIKQAWEGTGVEIAVERIQIVPLEVPEEGATIWEVDGDGIIRSFRDWPGTIEEDAYEEAADRGLLRVSLTHAPDHSEGRLYARSWEEAADIITKGRIQKGREIVPLFRSAEELDLALNEAGG
jgi:hypothetical protein